MTNNLLIYLFSYCFFGYHNILKVLVQALAAIPSIDSEAVQLRLDRVRTYFELLNMPFEVLI